MSFGQEWVRKFGDFITAVPSLLGSHLTATLFSEGGLLAKMSLHAAHPQNLDCATRGP